MKLLLLIPFMLIGSCVVKYDARPSLPKTVSELKVEVAECESKIKDFEAELEDAKKVRDVYAKALERADGWWQKDQASTDLSRANTDVEFTQFYLRTERARMEAAKAQLKELEQVETTIE